MAESMPRLCVPNAWNTVNAQQILNKNVHLWLCKEHSDHSKWSSYCIRTRVADTQ